MAFFEGNNMTGGYGNGPDIINSCSVNVERGEIVSILGPNGAGKTTCFYMIVGLVKPDTGSIVLDKIEISKMPIYSRGLQGISYLPQEPSIFRGMNVEDNLLSIIEIVEKNIGHGPNVEKLVCRGYKPGVGVAGRGGLKLNQLPESNPGLDGIIITNKLQTFSESENLSNNAPPCVRREPLYTHYKVFGNIIIMAEPLNTEDEKDTSKFIENLASKLLE